MQTIDVAYADWKAFAQVQASSYHQAQDTGVVYAFAGNSEFVLRSLISGSDYTDWSAVFPYSVLVPSGDQVAFLCIRAGNTKLAPSPKAGDGRPRMASEKTDGPKKNFFSHDWTDPTTWYTTAARVVGETPTPIVAGVSYQLAHTHVIDMFHGKIFGEDFLVDATGNTFRVSVAVNGVTKSEVDPHTLVGDFAVDYATGHITFSPPISALATVTVTYHRMVDSTFVVKPDAGKLLKIEFAEVQFSGDVVISDSVVFQPYGLVDVFAPQLVPGVPSGTLIPLGNPIVYKGMRDYQTEAVKAYPAVVAIGGSGWRGMVQPVLIFDWDYVASTVIRSDAQMEVRLRLQHDTAFGGSFATCSFYCVSEAL